MAVFREPSFPQQRFIEHKAVESLDLDKAYRRALEVLSQDAIDPSKFIHLYGKEDVKRDIEYVERMRSKFKEGSENEETAKLATIFEAVIHEQAELGEWFGPETHTFRTSAYDDIRNGVDSVAEFREEGKDISHLALAIDVTFSPEVRRKFSNIKREIQRGRLTSIKYFPPRGLDNIPRVVVGADIRTVKELTESWLRGDKKKLAAHPIQIQLLEEMRVQLRVFEEYAQKINQQGVIQEYRERLKIIERIQAVKGTPGQALKRDQVSSELYRHLVQEFGSPWLMQELG